MVAPCLDSLCRKLGLGLAGWLTRLENLWRNRSLKRIIKSVISHLAVALLSQYCRWGKL